MKTSIKPEVRKALLLGTMCSISYLAVYFARSILGAVTPEILESGSFSAELIGGLSSLYFITYAIGQLINGIIGDKIKAKYMICLGMIFAGFCNMIFPYTSGAPWLSYLAYGLTGFFLSMIYGPMTKLVAENTEPIYATRCSIGYTFASFFGSPMAGVAAMFLAWQSAFTASSFALIAMALICFIVFHSIEKKGILQYGKYNPPSKNKPDGIKILIRHRIIRFSLISAVTGIIRTSVVFWLPTYFSQRLGFSAEKSALLFTISSLLLSCCTFAAIFFYERLHYNIDLATLIYFIISALSFFGAWMIEEKILNAAMITLAIFASNCSASLLWCCYCPSLRDTGMVSSATGFLDFISYIAAAVSSTLFANAASAIGWSNLVLVWTLLAVVGVICMIQLKKIRQ